MRAGPFRDFYRSTGGLVVVVLAGGMSVIGGFLIGRLSRDQVEQRVFGSGATVPLRDAP